MRLRYVSVFMVLIGLITFGESGRCFGGVREIKRDIRLLNLINGLELTEAQMRLIIQKAEEAEKAGEELQKRSKDAGFVKVLTSLRDNLIQGKQVSPELKRQVHRNQKLTREEKNDLRETITELAMDIKEGLYSHQLYVLDKYKPCLILPEGSAAGQVEGSRGVERLLARVRNMPAPAFEKRKEELVQRIIEHIKRALPRGFIIEEGEEKRILDILEEARYLSDVDFSLRKTELVQKLNSKYVLPKLPVDISVKIERFLLDPEIIPLLKEKLVN